MADSEPTEVKENLYIIFSEFWISPSMKTNLLSLALLHFLPTLIPLTSLLEMIVSSQIFPQPIFVGCSQKSVLLP